MALINRPLTEDEARQMRMAWRKGWPKIPTFYDMLIEAMENPTPHVVHYHGITAVRRCTYRQANSTGPNAPGVQVTANGSYRIPKR